MRKDKKHTTWLSGRFYYMCAYKALAHRVYNISICPITAVKFDLVTSCFILKETLPLFWVACPPSCVTCLTVSTFLLDVPPWLQFLKPQLPKVSRHEKWLTAAQTRLLSLIVFFCSNSSQISYLALWYKIIWLNPEVKVWNCYSHQKFREWSIRIESKQSWSFFILKTVCFDVIGVDTKAEL